MKILHVYKRYSLPPHGGVEKVIHQLVTGLEKFKIESSVLAIAELGQETGEKDNVYQMPQSFEIASSPFSLKAFAKFVELAHQADIIHYHFPWPFGDVLHIYAKLLAHIKKPTVLTYHSDIVKQKYFKELYKPCMNYFLRDMDRVIATSPNYLKSSPVLCQYSDKVNVIPIGLDETSYPMPSDQKCQYWSSRFGSQFILFMGVMRYYKGLQFLVEAAKDLHVPIVVAGPEGHYGNKIRSLAASYNIRNIHFIGPISEEDKTALFKTCYGVVLPSHLRSEAFGISLLEGAMFGKPLISCEIQTGTTYINVHQQTGLVVPPADASSLAQAIQYLLDHPQQALTMGKEAQSRFFQLFTGQQMVHSYVDVYKEIMPMDQASWHKGKIASCA